jgi:electron transport complex protein RnfA
MTEYLLLLVGTVLINNFVLVKFLGLCPFMGVSGKLETAIGMGLATTFVMTLASACSYLMEHYILIPLNIAYLRTLAFILVIAVVVQFTEMVIRKSSPTLYRLLGIFQLCRAGGGAAEHQRASQLHSEHHLRFWGRLRLLAGAYPVCRHA